MSVLEYLGEVLADDPDDLSTFLSAENLPVPQLRARRTAEEHQDEFLLRLSCLFRVDPSDSGHDEGLDVAGEEPSLLGGPEPSPRQVEVRKERFEDDEPHLRARSFELFHDVAVAQNRLRDDDRGFGSLT